MAKNHGEVHKFITFFSKRQQRRMRGNNKESALGSNARNSVAKYFKVNIKCGLSDSSGYNLEET
jgi:hypothetical protein